MITNSSDIREIRPISDNKNDSKRIDPYIIEIEETILCESIGASIYEQLVSSPQEESITITNTVGKDITLSVADVKSLFSGGYYSFAECGINKRKMTSGIKKAVSYLAYSRIVRNDQLNLTAFGTVVKQGQFSEPADYKIISMSASDAEKTGIFHLKTVVDFLKDKNIIGIHKRISRSKRIKIIGD